ncbi:hypothetical protein [Spirillospora sp. NPDC047279]|uniref:hypothetical protein n=1 Tax=Spirillospora sp. NPDC047279 TaxID=3155478 RepID=UPI0033F97A26
MSWTSLLSGGFALVGICLGAALQYWFSGRTRQEQYAREDLRLHREEQKSIYARFLAKGREAMEHQLKLADAIAEEGASQNGEEKRKLEEETLRLFNRQARHELELSYLRWELELFAPPDVIEAAEAFQMTFDEWSPGTDPQAYACFDEFVSAARSSLGYSDEEYIRSLRN